MELSPWPNRQFQAQPLEHIQDLAQLDDLFALLQMNHENLPDPAEISNILPGQITLLASIPDSLAQILNRGDQRCRILTGCVHGQLLVCMRSHTLAPNKSELQTNYAIAYIRCGSSNKDV